MLKLRENEKLYNLWRMLTLLMVFSMFVYLLLYQFAPNYFGRLFNLVYKLLPLVALPCFLLMRGLKDGAEIRLMFVFCLLASLLRFIDGSYREEAILIIVLGLWMCLPCLAAASLADSKLRYRLLDAVSIVVTTAYTLIGLPCIYTGITGNTIYHPLTGVSMCELIGGRLYLFYINCNSVSGWYFMMLLLLFYLFFRSKKLWQRLLLALEMLICYTCLALTYGRGGMLAFAVGMGMLAAALGLKHLPLKKHWHRLCAVLLLVCAVSPLAYKSFQLGTGAISAVSNSIYAQHQQESPEEKSEPAAQSNAEMLNSRGMGSSGRTTLWIASLECVLEEPIRLLTGRSMPMEETNAYIKEHYPQETARYGNRPNHHNTYLELFQMFGLPGFLLMMAFFVLLTVKMIRLYFAPEAEIYLKVIIMMLSGIMVYNLFESTLFCIYDMRTVVFCVLSGYVLAAERELAQ